MNVCISHEKRQEKEVKEDSVPDRSVSLITETTEDNRRSKEIESTKQILRGKSKLIK